MAPVQAQHLRIELAGMRREHQAVLAAVERIAGREHAIDHQLAVRITEREAGLRPALCIFRRNGIESRCAPAQSEVREPRASGGRAGDDAVEIRREALRHHHRLATAGGASHPVAVVRRLAVILLHHLLGDHRDGGIGLVEEVQQRFLVFHERGIEAGALVARIVAHHREARGQRCGVPRCLSAHGRIHAAVETAAALEEEPAIPVPGQRQREADAIRFAIAACTRIDDAIHPAMRGQRGTRPRWSAGRSGSGARRDFRCLVDRDLVARHRELRQCRTACGRGSRGQRHARKRAGAECHDQQRRMLLHADFPRGLYWLSCRA